MKILTGILALAIIALVGSATSMAGSGLRQTLSLDGMWQIAEGNMEQIPTVFEHSVPVPGLVDLATPAFVEVGPKVADRNKVPQKDPRRDAFWYRRSFSVAGAVPAVAMLKVGKAMFGTRV
jgi:beta-galactosidase